jgi:hypothetical protein
MLAFDGRKSSHYPLLLIHLAAFSFVSSPHLDRNQSLMRRNSSRQRFAGAIAAVGSIAALAMLIPMSASAVPVGSIVQLSSFSPADGFTSCGSTSIATNADSGVTLAAWAGTQGGPALSAPLNVATIGANAAPGPTVTYLPADSTPLAPPGNCEPLSVNAGSNGGFIVTWNDADTDGAVYGILVDSTGAFVGSTFVVSSNTNYSDIETTSAAWSAADSRYLVTWKANVSGPFPSALNDQQIVGRFVDGAGVPIGADFLVTNIVEEIDDSQDVAYGGGTWLVAGVGNADDILRAVRVAADGTVDAPILVPAPTGTGNGPGVDFNAVTGQFLVTGQNSDGPWGQLVLPSGVLVGAPFAIDTIIGGGKPRVASLGAEGWLIVWHAPGGADVYAIRVDAAGVPVGVAELMSSGANDTDVESNFRPGVAFSATAGQAYVVWSRNIVADDETNVVIRAWQATAPTVADPVAGPVLAATGVNAQPIALLAGALALVGAVAVSIGARRRRTVVGSDIYGSDI